MKHTRILGSLVACFWIIDVLHSQQTSVELVDNSGQDQIMAIMKHVKHDIIPGCQASISYAQVANIDDLNIDAVADWFGCKTLMGKAFLAESLRNPVSGKDETGIVQLRHEYVMELVNNPEYKQEVEELLSYACKHEATVIELMSQTFKNQHCPQLATLAQLKKNEDLFYHLVNFVETNSYFKTYDYLSTACMIPVLWAGTGMFTYAACNEQIRMHLGDPTVPECLGQSVYAGLLSALTTYQWYNSLVKVGIKRPKIHALHQLVSLAESLEEVSGAYGLATQFKMSLITDAQALGMIQELKSSWYAKESNYFINPGAVHTFLYRIYENDAALAQVFASIAEIDAYNAIANQILAGKESSRSFCIAHKIQDNKPQVNSQLFWNVLVPYAVTNSIVQDRNIIITGPNAGGKTTAIRAILQNIVLAQTYGIAAAQEFSFTEFDVILSYLHISDDLLHGYSLFASEIKRAQELLEIIQTLNPDQKLFFALDELFTGTVAEQGEQCAYNFIKKTSTFDQVLSIYATHFKALKDLGDTDARMMNYKVDAPVKNDAGKLVYPYTLSPGASNVCIALDMAREANLFE